MIKETKFKEFVIGQQVWLEGKNIKRPYDSPKLSPKRYGPFRVVAKISPVAYKLQIPATWQIHDVFHASLLTPYKETVEHGKNFLEPPPDVIEGEEEWEVEQVLGKRYFGRGKRLQYLVRWKGYSPAHDQWVLREDMAADDLVEIFEREHGTASGSRPARSKKVRATEVDFDSPDIASSREASAEPEDILATRTRKHWAESLDPKERTRLNAMVLLARAAVVFRAKHGRFPCKLRRGLFNLVHRLGRIKGTLTAYPADFTAQDFGKLDSLIQNFGVIHGELQPLVGVPVKDIKRKTKSRSRPASGGGFIPTSTPTALPPPPDAPRLPPTPDPVMPPRPRATTNTPRLTPQLPTGPAWEQLLHDVAAAVRRTPVTPVLSPTPMRDTPSPTSIVAPPPPVVLTPPSVVMALPPPVTLTPPPAIATPPPLVVYKSPSPVPMQ